jgi:ADP-heptose:LPS heptosyltransferase
VPGSYSLLGLTNPRQLIGVVGNCDLVITLDNFVLHAARLMDIPTIALWGPTKPEMHGYPEHINLLGQPSSPICQKCIDGAIPENYATVCPIDAALNCFATISPSYVFSIALSKLDVR